MSYMSHTHRKYMNTLITKYLPIFTVLVSAWSPVSGEQITDLCSSIAPSTINIMNGMDENGAELFVEKNRSLMNLKIIWLDGDTPASCTHVYVTKIRKVKDETNGTVEVAYARGESIIWGFSPKVSSGKGSIKDGKLSVRWSYGTIEVTQSNKDVFEVLWIGSPSALVSGKIKGQVIEVLEPL